MLRHLKPKRRETFMPDPHEQRSEVAHLLAQISSEYEAAQQGLSGLAQGTCQHRFITRRMECIAELHSQLHGLLGDKAMALISDHLDREVEGEQASLAAPTENVR
jgi:hypothetical protein